MTMKQTERDALTQNWDQAKSQVQAQFPDLNEDDLNQGRSNPDGLVQRITEKTGQDQSSVERSLGEIAGQYR